MTMVSPELAGAFAGVVDAADGEGEGLAGGRESKVCWMSGSLPSWMGLGSISALLYSD